MQKALVYAIPAVMFSLGGVVAPAHADSSRSVSQFLSGTGNIIYLAAGVGLPLLRDGDQGRNHALRAADALGTSVVLAEIGKNIFREKRPDSNERDSFPSGHATAAFAIAGVESSFHPKEAPYWILGATAISASRVALHRHFVHDVLVGAALGWGTARWELGQPRGLILAPIIGRNDRGVRAQYSMNL